MPLLEVVEDDCGDVSGTVFVVKAAEEDDADGLEPAIACVGCDDAPRLALRAPGDALRRVRGGLTVFCRVEPEGWDTVWVAESDCKTAVMEDHGAWVQRIPPVAPQAGPCKDRGGTASCVERGLDPVPRQHDAVEACQLVRDRAPHLLGEEAEPEVAAIVDRQQGGGVAAAVGLEPVGAEAEHAAACLFLNKLWITSVQNFTYCSKFKIIAQNSKKLLKITNINKH